MAVRAETHCSYRTLNVGTSDRTNVASYDRRTACLHLCRCSCCPSKLLPAHRRVVFALSSVFFICLSKENHSIEMVSIDKEGLRSRGARRWLREDLVKNEDTWL
jgi:hypothetical protein